MPNAICPHCGKVDWSNAPRAHAVLRFVERRKSATSAEVADAFGLSIANAANTMSRLVRMGFLRHDDGTAHPTGGVVRTYQPVIPTNPDEDGL